jgi:hypothetical protein
VELVRPSDVTTVTFMERYSTAQCKNFADGLPDSLEQLIIHDCDRTILVPVSALVNSDMPPRLKNIEVSADPLFECGISKLTLDSWLHQMIKAWRECKHERGTAVWLSPWRRV